MLEPWKFHKCNKLDDRGIHANKLGRGRGVTSCAYGKCIFGFFSSGSLSALTPYRKAFLCKCYQSTWITNQGVMAVRKTKATASRRTHSQHPRRLVPGKAEGKRGSHLASARESVVAAPTLLASFPRPQHRSSVIGRWTASPLS